MALDTKLGLLLLLGSDNNYDGEGMLIGWGLCWPHLDASNPPGVKDSRGGG